MAVNLRRPLPWPLSLGVLGGILVALADAAPLAKAGFPALLAASVLPLAVEGLLLASLFLVLAKLWSAVMGTRATRFWGSHFGAALALAPVVAWLGYRLNRELGVRPAEIFKPYALWPNLALVSAAAVALLLAAYRVRTADRRTPAAQRGGRALRWSYAPLIVAGGLALVTAAAFRPGQDKARLDVFVLLVDALRADELGAYGYPRATTPAIDAFAADGILFEQAVSASTFTKSSIASLFTGRYPYQHGVYWGSHREDPNDPDSVTADLLSAEETTLAEALRGHGYLTAAWVQNSHLRGEMGFAQGFVDYQDQQGNIERINRRFGRWLGRAGRRYPFFAYLHYIDLHDPYRPSPPYDTMFGGAADLGFYEDIDLAQWGSFLHEVRSGERTLTSAQIAQLRSYYDGQLRAIDGQIGRLFEKLKREGRYDSSLIVVTSDHGDGFGEHGFISHSTVPYEELVRVPLIIKLPDNRSAGRRIGQQVRLIDLLPTILDLTGVKAPTDGGGRADLAGCSLVPMIRLGSRPPEMAHCGEAVVEIAQEGAYPVVAARSERFKYIHHQHRGDELYDLAHDPGELENLLAAGGQAAVPLSGEPLKLERLALAAVELRGVRKAERVELDAETIRELKALGYLD